MDEKRRKQARFADVAARSQRVERARALIDQIVSDQKARGNSHFSSNVYQDEPLLKTGRQMANYLPDRYREMRAISRWDESGTGGRGRWLSEAELFWRQGTFMADFEDDCPYHGNFKSYYPTYNAMSDRQLRGYFTWRSRVRAGELAEAPDAFALVYIYEVLCGIGVDDPARGFETLKWFCDAWHSEEKDIKRHGLTWQQDYVVYHGLDPKLLAQTPSMEFEASLCAFARALASYRKSAGLDEMDEPSDTSGMTAEATARATATARKRKGGPLPRPDADVAGAMLDAAARLSAHRIDADEFHREHQDDMRAVMASVLVRLDQHHRSTRGATLVEVLFGKRIEMPYTMFASAVFFEERAHADARVTLNPLRSYRCTKGLWTCDRVHCDQGRNIKLGNILREIDRRMRIAWEWPRLLDEDGTKTPKYLQKMIDTEIKNQLEWSRAHQPVRIDIDLSKLSGIRSAAAQTREALLIEEERGDATASGSALLESAASVAGVDVPSTAGSRPAPPRTSKPSPPRASEPSPSQEPPSLAKHADEEPRTAATQPPATLQSGPFTPEQASYLADLLAGSASPRVPAGTSEDMLVDAINDAAFDLVGDTILEFAAGGVRLIEDYREDVEGYING